MEWYMSDIVDDLVVPDDECARSTCTSQEKLKLWGLNTFNECRNLSVADDDESFSCETFLDQLEMDFSIRDGDQAEISGLQGSTSESSNCWTALLNNQDYQLDGFPSTHQTDDDFMNTLLVDDLRASDQFQFYSSPKSQCTHSSEDNLNSDMEQSDTFRRNHQTMISTAYQYNASLESHLQDVRGVRFVNEIHSTEETVLQELGSAVQKMTNETRLCFRDATYRLATNSAKDSSVIHGGNFSSEKRVKTTSSDQNPRLLEIDKTETEHSTNTIDRTIADLLFNKTISARRLPSVYTT